MDEYLTKECVAQKRTAISFSRFKFTHKLGKTVCRLYILWCDIPHFQCEGFKAYIVPLIALNEKSVCERLFSVIFRLWNNWDITFENRLFLHLCNTILEKRVFLWWIYIDLSITRWFTIAELWSFYEILRACLLEW